MSSIVEAAAAFGAVLAAAGLDELTDPERIDELTALERVKSAAFARAGAGDGRVRPVAAGSAGGSGFEVGRYQPVGVWAGRVGPAGQPAQGEPARRVGAHPGARDARGAGRVGTRRSQ